MAQTPQILLVEDEPSISDTIVYALGSDGFGVTLCTTIAEALEAAKKSEFALGIFDIGLPDGSGFDLLRQLRARTSMPVIFLTARSAEVDRVSGLEMGADDYVVKPFSPRELVARVRTVLRRLERPQAEPGTAAGNNSGPFTHDEKRLSVAYRGTPLTLSRYEYRLLCVLLRSPGRVYSREQLMQLAWEDPEMSLERTVDAHIKSIRAKLRKAGADPDPIVTHRGFGYSLREEKE
jgi:two-component system catabolic regulation response regulator CreB